MHATDGVIQVSWQNPGRPLVVLPPEAATMGGRIPPLLGFCERAVSWLQAWGHPQGQFNLQVHDNAPPVPSFRFDAPAVGDPGGPLIPDPYVLGSGGFAAVRHSFQRQPLPPWEQRLPMAIWRGSSTGIAALHRRNLAENLRYQLCQLSQRWPQLLDARLTAVVQGADQLEQNLLSAQLRAGGFVAPRLTPWHLALHRWLIEIDGNVNSWGLLWKLMSGCCVLRVTSTRRQWYHHRLEPWVHVVPVAADLSNLTDTLAWCRTQPALCRRIATAGQQLAFEVVAHLEEDQQRAVQQWALPWIQPPPGNQPTG